MVRRPAFLSALAQMLLSVSPFTALAFAIANVFVLPPAIGQRDEALSAIQAHIGDRWVYSYESKDGDPRMPEVHRWTSKQTITAIVNIPQGEVVLRTVQYQGDFRGHLTYASSHSDGDYLVHAGCIYFLSDAWANGGLKPNYLEWFSKGEISPDICFPLDAGNQWGNVELTWRVIGVDNNPPQFLPLNFTNAIHIATNHLGSGGLDDLWFEKALGVVGERYFHGGTYDEYTKVLQRFIPAN